jgi:hypothetical protein
MLNAFWPQIRNQRVFLRIAWQSSSFRPLHVRRWTPTVAADQRLESACQSNVGIREQTGLALRIPGRRMPAGHRPVPKMLSAIPRL